MTNDRIITFASWNILQGGFKAYNPHLVTAVREPGIQAVINDMHTVQQASNLSIIDAYRWNELYEDDAGIAAHLGYKSARFVPIDDARINARIGPGVGIVFATDHPISQSRILDLYSRQGLVTIIQVGDQEVQVATIYLDDLSETIRLKQVQALHAGLKPHIPTIILGDFNALRPSMAGASFSTKLRDGLVRSVSTVIPRWIEVGATLKGMNQRTVIPALEELGYRDADRQKRQTIPARAPVLGLDYIFHTDHIAVDTMTTLSARGQSDHRPILATVSIE